LSLHRAAETIFVGAGAMTKGVELGLREERADTRLRGTPRARRSLIDHHWTILKFAPGVRIFEPPYADDSDCEK
jgi:hypothetical protein